MKVFLPLLLLLTGIRGLSQTAQYPDSAQAYSLFKEAAEIFKTDRPAAKKLTVEALALAANGNDHYLQARCYRALAIHERPFRNAALLRYDSLFLRHAEAARNDTLTMNACNAYGQDLSNLYRWEKAVALLDKGTALAERTGDKKRLADLYITWGFYHEQKNNYEAAIASLRKSRQIFAGLGNQLMLSYAGQQLATTTLSKLGHLTDETLGYLSDAVYYYQKNNKPVEEATCLDIIGSSYQMLGNTGKALPYFWQARHLFKTAREVMKVIDEDIGLATLYLLQKNNTDSAGYYLAAAKKASEQYGYQKGKTIVANLEIHLHTLMKDFKKAEESATQSRNLNAGMNRGELDLMANEAIGMLKDAKGEKDSLSYYFDNKLAILKRLHPPAVLARMTEEDFRKAGITDAEAIDHAKKLLGISDTAYTRAAIQDPEDSLYTTLLNSLGAMRPGTDSILQAVQQKQLVEMEEKFKNRSYRDSIAVQDQKIKLDKASLKQKNLWLAASTLAVALLLLLGLYLYKSRRQAQKLRRAEESLRLAEEEKRKTVEQLKVYTEHQVDNILSIIQSIVSETKMASTDETSFMKLEGRIEPLFLLYNMLKETPSDEIPMQGYLEKICHSLRQSYQGGKRVSVEVEAHQTLSGKKAGTLGLIVNELVTNSFKYAFREQSAGTIAVRLKAEGKRHVLHVCDNGAGLGQATRVGLGTGLVKDLAYALRAEVKQYDRNGANFEIIFM